MAKSKMYRFYELRDEIRKAIQNSNFVEEQQKELVATLIQAKKDDQFKEFIKATTAEWKTQEHQRATLNTQLQAVNKLIAIHEKQDDNAKLLNEWVDLFFDAIGMEFTSSNKPN